MSKRCVLSAGGFTLIEIMVAMVVFSLVFLPLTAILVAESKLGAASERKRVAMLVARNELEIAKKTRLDLTDETYDVPMAGKTWRIQRIVENGEGISDKNEKVVQLTAVSVRVSEAHDTSALADFSVIRETYK
ncbi:MAG: prepilin-type N-terminal cleavage/methylation domain-containing protein [Chitinispirillaceae bacterium]|jgi:prepilin-type N-terminal cleavage/methylation domain-containing protein|nr:prepilin-type N-terminal cleavage/methylation domain-containing protein [Chitinispirillaceae bacterium]